MDEITFAPVTAADLPLLRDWLDTPHWREWWGDPEEEIAAIAAMVEGRDSTRPFLFRVDGEPAGYIQVWRIADARSEPWLTEAPWLALLGDGCVGVDLSIGPAWMLSRGLGSAALAGFVARLRAEGHGDIVIDPDPRNARAIRAYHKAGFRPVPEVEGRFPGVLLMRHDPAVVTPPSSPPYRRAARRSSGSGSPSPAT